MHVYVHMNIRVYFLKCFAKILDDSGYVKMRKCVVFSYFEYIIFLLYLLFWEAFCRIFFCVFQMQIQMQIVSTTCQYQQHPHIDCAERMHNFPRFLSKTTRKASFHLAEFESQQRMLKLFAVADQKIDFCSLS